MNGMVVSGIDPLDVRRWEWPDAYDHQQAILDRLHIELVQPGPFTLAFGQMVGRGFTEGPPTAISDSRGWSPLSLAMRDGRRFSVADAFLADAPSCLTVRTGAEVDRIDGNEVVLADGDRIEADHVALAAGSFNSAALLVRSGLIDQGLVAEPLNHSTTVVVAQLSDELQVTGELGAPSSRLLRTATGIGVKWVDLQIMVLDYTGDTDEGRRHGAVIISALEPVRKKVMIAGINLVLRWLAEMPGVGKITLGEDQTPVSHQCCTLTEAFEGGRVVPGASHVSVIDAATLPALPHTNPMLPIMIGARRWGKLF